MALAEDCGREEASDTGASFLPLPAPPALPPAPLPLPPAFFLPPPFFFSFCVRRRSAPHTQRARVIGETRLL